MNEKTVKITLEIPVQVNEFLRALSVFTGVEGEALNEYVVKCMTQGILDSINPNADGVKAIDFKQLVEKYGLEEDEEDP